MTASANEPKSGRVVEPKRVFTPGRIGALVVIGLLVLGFGYLRFGLSDGAVLLAGNVLSLGLPSAQACLGRRRRGDGARLRSDHRPAELHPEQVARRKSWAGQPARLLNRWIAASKDGSDGTRTRDQRWRASARGGLWLRWFTPHSSSPPLVSHLRTQPFVSPLVKPVEVTSRSVV